MRKGLQYQASGLRCNAAYCVYMDTYSKGFSQSLHTVCMIFNYNCHSIGSLLKGDLRGSTHRHTATYSLLSPRGSTRGSVVIVSLPLPESRTTHWLLMIKKNKAVTGFVHSLFTSPVIKRPARGLLLSDRVQSVIL